MTPIAGEHPSYTWGDHDGPEDEDAPEERLPTTWQPVDLTAAIERRKVEEPTIGARRDGVCLLYPGRVHSFQGESESMKSFGAQLICRQEIAAGHDVLYIDFEDDEHGVVERLIALGCSPDELLAHFVYVHPDEPLRTRHDEATAALLDFVGVLKRSFSLCVIDGVTESMVIEGLELTDNSDVAQWMRRLPKFIAKHGPAVAVIDHLTKAREGQGRYAIGGQHKLAGLDGVAYKFTITQYLSRARGTEPSEGRAEITVEKDRRGFIRAKAVDGSKIARLVVTSYPDGGVTASFDPPGEGSATDRRMVQRVLEFLSVYEGSSGRKVEDGIEGKGTLIAITDFSPDSITEIPHL